MPFVVGENIGPYRLIEQRGQGGMATVFKAYHPALDRYVAIKVMHPAFTQQENFLARFRREAQVVARLEHPNIVPVYDYAEYENRPYLVMKFIEGETLKRRLERGPIAWQELLKIVESVGAALSYAHAQGVLHRDVKPSNVLLANDGRVYLADFGLARIAEAGESTISTDSMLGTPQYISPEQALGRKDLDQRVDIYSFGVVLYELLVGRVPFSADTPYSIIHDHIYAPLPLPRSLNPNLSEAVERVLLKALAKDRNDRYENVEKLLAAWHEAVGPDKGEAAPELVQVAGRPSEPPVELVQVTSRPADLAANVAQTVVLDEGQVNPPPAAPLRDQAQAGAPIVSGRPRGAFGRWRWAFVALLALFLLAAGAMALLPGLRNRIALRQGALAPSAVPLAAALPSPTAGALPSATLASPTAASRPPTAELRRSPDVLHQVAQLVTQHPNDPDAHLELAMAYMAEGKPFEARQALEKAVRLAGNTPEFMIHAGDRLLERQSWLAAAGMYVLAIQRLPSPAPPEVQDHLYQSMYMAASLPEAGDLLIFLPEDRLTPGIAELCRGRHALFQGELPTARSIARRLREEFPDMREVGLLEAEIALKSGEVEAGRKKLNDLLGDPLLSPWGRRVAQYLLKQPDK